MLRQTTLAKDQLQYFCLLSFLRHLAERIDGSQVVGQYCDRPLSSQGVQGLEMVANHLYNIRHLVLNQGIMFGITARLCHSLLSAVQTWGKMRPNKLQPAAHMQLRVIERACMQGSLTRDLQKGVFKASLNTVPQLKMCASLPVEGTDH